MCESWSHLLCIVPYQGKSYRKKKKSPEYPIGVIAGSGNVLPPNLKEREKEYISIGDNAKRTNSQSPGPLSETHKQQPEQVVGDRF